MRKINVGSRYKHFKGDMYDVIQKGIYADNENSGAENIGYKRVGDDTIYIRSTKEFASKVDKVKYPNAPQKYRFQEQNPDHHNGLFITVEGGDRVGKSYAIDRTMELFGDIFNIIRTREPGGRDNALAEKIRTLILDKDNAEMTKKTEMYLYAASRAQHVENTIKPLLDNYNIVLSDRFIHSSVVYQTIDSDMTAEQIYEYNKLATEDEKYLPDHTFIFYLDDENELERRFNNTESEKDRIESRDIEFFKSVNRAYREVEFAHPTRTTFHYIECSGDKEQVLFNFLKEFIPVVVEYINKNSLLDYDVLLIDDDKKEIILTPNLISYECNPEYIKISWAVNTFGNKVQKSLSSNNVIMSNNETNAIIIQNENLLLDKDNTSSIILSKILMGI